jgi:hypothetical protein
MWFLGFCFWLNLCIQTASYSHHCELTCVSWGFASDWTCSSRFRIQICSSVRLNRFLPLIGFSMSTCSTARLSRCKVTNSLSQPHILKRTHIGWRFILQRVGHHCSSLRGMQHLLQQQLLQLLVRSDTPSWTSDSSQSCCAKILFCFCKRDASIELHIFSRKWHFRENRGLGWVLEKCPQRSEYFFCTTLGQFSPITIHQ